MTSMRGLTVFISDIRGCQNREGEVRRVEKEMAKIRAKFTGTKSLSPYDRRKYVWKMVYMHMLGYEVDFGHMEVINLITSPKFVDKAAGYLATSLLMHSAAELKTLIVNSVRNDIAAGTDHAQCLALSLVANMGGREFADALSHEVLSLLAGARPSVSKKAALCLLRMYRANPDVISLDEWAPRLVSLLDSRDLGVLTASTSLVYAVSARSPKAMRDVVPKAVALLARLVLQRGCPPDYEYYGTPAPWLQVKLLRLLQLFPQPSDSVLARLTEVVTKVITKTDVTRSVNKNNTEHAVLFEAMNLVMHYGNDSDASLRNQAVSLLGRYIAVREPNIRYLALECMAKLAQLEGTAAAVKRNQSTVLSLLRDADVSIRKRALDLMFVMCDQENSAAIVNELLGHLVVADVQLKEEMVLKIAILAERFAADLQWYINVVLQLISLAGDFVSDDVWHRAVQVVSAHEDLQKHAARMAYHAVIPAVVHETTVKVAGYLLGEYGYLLADEDADAAPAPSVAPGGGGAAAGAAAGDADALPSRATGVEQFAALRKHFATVGLDTRALLMHSFVKMVNLYPELKEPVQELLRTQETSLDAEIQQRAVEYLHLPDTGEVFHQVLEPMPPFPEDRENMLMARLEKAQRRRDGEEEEEETEERRRRHSGDDDDEEEAAAAAGSESESEDERPAARKSSKSDKPAASAGPAQEEDLLGFSSMASAAAPATAAAPAAAAPAAEPSRIVGLDPALAAPMRNWFRHLLVVPQAVLYEDAVVQIGCKHEYQPPQGRISLFVGNKSAHPLTSLTLEVPSTPALAAQVQAAPPTLAARQQAVQMVAVEAMQPFTDPPLLNVSFVCDGALHKLPLRLPVMVNCFCSPMEMGSADFLQRWKALEGMDREQQTVFKAGVPMDIAAVRGLVTSGLHLGIVPDLDSSGAAVAAAGTYRTGTVGPNGAKVAVGVLLRIEANAAAEMFRVTVRATHAMVSVAVRNVVVNQLGSR